MSKQLKQIWIIVLVITMAFSHLHVNRAYAKETEENSSGKEIELTITDVDPSAISVPKLGTIEDGTDVESGQFKADDIVRVSIFLDKPPVLKAGYSATKLSANQNAMAYKIQLVNYQNDIQKAIENRIGAKLDVNCNLTITLNAISTNVRYGDIDTIRSIKGVTCVQLENYYEPCSTDWTDAGYIHNTAASSQYLTGASDLWDAGYTGAGMRIAIIDTGIDVNHEAFSEEMFNYSIDELESQTGNEYDLFEKAEVDKFAESIGKDDKGNDIFILHSADKFEYINRKIPYACNYVHFGGDISHFGVDQGNHGSHVAGIAASNKYVRDKDGNIVKSIEENLAIGMAPDAQLLIMKVFDNGSASESSIAEALEDAILLDCDACNISIGELRVISTYNSEYQKVIQEIADGSYYDGGMVVSISGGNYSNFISRVNTFHNNKTVLLEDTHMETGGMPGTSINAFTVANAENVRFADDEWYKINGFDARNESYDTVLWVDDTLYIPYKSRVYDDGEDNLYDLGEKEYVYMECRGDVDNVETVNNYVSLQNKVLIINDGSAESDKLTRIERIQNLIPYDPVAVIIVVNGVTKHITEYNAVIPGLEVDFPIAFTYGRFFKDPFYDNENAFFDFDAESTLDVIVYGSLIANKKGSVPLDKTRDDVAISATSSWGGAGSLVLKPDITAPGTYIFSVFGARQEGDPEDRYVSLNGTSMAAPHIAGLSTILAQYLDDHNISIEGYTRRALIQSLLMSTATPMKNPATSTYYPVVQQGAGLVDANMAMKSNSIIMMENNPDSITELNGSARDGKVKIELGEQNPLENEYHYSFRIYNISDNDLYFTAPTTDVFTQGYYYSDKYISDKPYVSLNTVSAGNQTRYSWKPSGNHYSIENFVPKNGYADVTIYFDFSVDLDIYTSGAYIEGFTKLTEITADNVTHSIPIYGFYGDYKKANMFDGESYIETLYGTDRFSYRSKPDTDNVSNYLTVKYPFDNDFVKYAGNPYAVEEQFPYERLAFNENTILENFNYTLIRPATSVGVALSKIDPETQKATVIWDMMSEYLFKGLPLTFEQYFRLEEVPESLCNGFRFAKQIKVLNLDPLKKYRIGLYAATEYDAMKYNLYDAKNVNDFTSLESATFTEQSFANYINKEAYGENSCIYYDFVIDNEQPIIESATIELIDDKAILHVTAYDNNNLAYLALYEDIKGEPLQSVVPKTAEYKWDIDITELYNTDQSIFVFAGDYAANEQLAVLRNDVDLFATFVDEDNKAGMMKFNPSTSEFAGIHYFDLSENKKIKSAYTAFRDGIITSYIPVFDESEKSLSVYTLDIETFDLVDEKPIYYYSETDDNKNLTFMPSSYFDYCSDRYSYIYFTDTSGVMVTEYETDYYFDCFDYEYVFDQECMIKAAAIDDFGGVHEDKMPEYMQVFHYYALLDNGEIWELKRDDNIFFSYGLNSGSYWNYIMDTNLDFGDGINANLLKYGDCLYLSRSNNGKTDLYCIFPKIGSIDCIGSVDIEITGLFMPMDVPGLQRLYDINHDSEFNGEDADAILQKALLFVASSSYNSTENEDEGYIPNQTDIDNDVSTTSHDAYCLLKNLANAEKLDGLWQNVINNENRKVSAGMKTNAAIGQCKAVKDYLSGNSLEEKTAELPERSAMIIPEGFNETDLEMKLDTDAVNALVTYDFDGEYVKFERLDANIEHVQYYIKETNPNKVYIAFASADPLEAGTVIANLHLSVKKCCNVSVNTKIEQLDDNIYYNRDKTIDIEKTHNWEFCKIEWNTFNSEPEAYVLYRCKDCHTYSGYIRVETTRKVERFWTIYTALLTKTESWDGEEHVSTYKVRNIIPPIPDHGWEKKKVFIDPTPIFTIIEKP